MSFPPFTADEVRRMLMESEGATLPDGRKKGHAGERHVSITNAGLDWRMRYSGGTVAGIAMYTAFLTFKDQIRTAVEVLNSPQSRPELGRFLADRSRKQCDLKDIVLTNSVPIRMATAGGSHVYPEASFATMILHRMTGRTRSIHVQTIFARISVAGYDA